MALGTRGYRKGIWSGTRPVVDATANDREYILAGALFPVFVNETGARSEVLPGPVYLVETS